MPQIRTQVGQAVSIAQKTMESIDTKSVTKKVKDAFNSADTSGLKISGIGEAKKQYQELTEEQQKMKDKMQKISDEMDNLKVGSEQYEKLKSQLHEINREYQNLPKNVVSPIVNNNTTNTTQNPTTIEPQTKSLNIWEQLRQKIAQIKPAIESMKQSVKSTSKEEEQLNYKIEQLKIKLQSLKSIPVTSKSFNYGEILKVEAELERLENKKQKINKPINGNIFSGLLSGTKKATSQLNNMSGITVKIRNQIKNMSSGMQMGLKQIMRCAGALFSMQGIYSMLSNSARSWLSSQNSQAKQLSANIEYMKYAMGSVFAPVIQYVTNLVYQLMKAIQNVVYALSGVNIFAKATASTMKSTASSANKTSKSLAGIHNEINNVSEEDSSSGGTGSTTPNIDLSQMNNISSTMLDAIKNGNWYEVGNLIGKKINEALEKIDWNSVQQKAKTIATNIGNFINGFVDGLDWKLLGRTIGNGVNTALIFADTVLNTTNFEKIGKSVANGLNSEMSTIDWNLLGKTIASGINSAIYIAYGFVTTFDWSLLGSSIAETINGFFQNVDWGMLAQTLSEGMIGIFDGIYSFFVTLDWESIVNAVITFFANVNWSGVSQSVFKALGSAFGSLTKLGTIIGGHLRTAIENAKQYFTDKVKECGGNVVAGILEGIADALIDIGRWINDNIFQPFIQGFKEAFGIHSPSTVMVEMGGYIIEGLKEGLTGIWEKIKDKFETLKTNISTKFTEIKGKVTTWAGDTKETIRSWAEDAKTKISNCWEKVSETVKDKVETVKTNISTKLGNSKITIMTWVGEVKSKWETHWQEMSDKVSSGMSNASEWIDSYSETIGSTLSGLGSSAITWGKDLVENMASGISKNIGKVTSATKTVAGKIKSLLGFSEPEEGPLSNFHTYMPDMIDLMVQGIHSNMNKVTKELENMTTTMSYTINSPDLATFDTSYNARLIKPNNVMAETFEDVFANHDFNSNNGQPVQIIVNVGNKRLGDVLIEDLRDRKRQTGNGIEVLVGG